MKNVILLLFVVFIFECIFAQQDPRIEFKKTTHDYGTIKQEIAEVKAEFTFKNTGNAPLIIQTVYPSCGCTSANYTKTPIMPGKKGSIEAVFHTKGSYGSFHKSIFVYTNDTANKIVTLYIDGKIVQKGNSMNDDFSQAIGNISFKSNHLAFNQLKNTEIKTDTFWFYNSGNKKMNIEIINNHDWLSLSKREFKLKPERKAYTLISFDASKRKDWGLNFDKLIMKTNDDTLSEKNIFVSADIEEDFSKLKPQELNDAPKIVFDSINFEFGEIKEGNNIQHEFNFTNVGKSDLIIRKIKSSCGCTVITNDNTIVKAGERSKITAMFFTEGKSGDQQKTITVICNDPFNSSITLSLIGVVIGQKK